jgi:PAS domain S-box-containing protein
MRKKIATLHTTKPENPNDPSGIREYYQMLIDAMPNNVYWLNRDCITMGCNRNTLDIIGLSKLEDFVGITYEEMGRLANWTEGQALSFKRDDMEVMATGKPKFNVEEPPVYDAQGNPRYYLSNRVPLFDENKNVIGVIGISVDITDRKKAEEREKKALLEAAEAKSKAQLEENLRLAVTVVAGRIAHDIRTPLNILLRKSENIEDLIPIVLEGYKKAEESGLDIEVISSREYDYLQGIPEAVTNEINKLNQFISSTLTMLSKVVTGEISHDDLEICWIDGVINRALKNYPYQDEQQQSLIDYKLEKDFTFLGNDILLIYAFYNLIKNSLYQIKNNKKGKIYITTESDEEANVVCFKDTAGGASPEIIKQFFSGYKTYKQEGTGLGLASIKQTMQLFGGDVTCNSKEGDFIEFIFTFPKLKK